MQNIEQERAQFAIERVEAVIQKLAPAQRSEFKSYVTSLPAMVQMNGLGQAIAFYRSKFSSLEDPGSGKGALAYKNVYCIIQDWLCDNAKPACVYKEGGDLLKAITSNDMYQYRLAQSELQKLLSWLKKVTASYINTEDANEN